METITEHFYLSTKQFTVFHNKIVRFDLNIVYMEVKNKFSIQNGTWTLKMDEKKPLFNWGYGTKEKCRQTIVLVTIQFSIFHWNFIIVTRYFGGNGGGELQLKLLLCAGLRCGIEVWFLILSFCKTTTTTTNIRTWTAHECTKNLKCK